MDDIILPSYSLPVPVSKLLGGCVIGLSVLRYFFSWVDEGFALVPRNTIYSPVLYIPVPFCWNVLTANFFEANPVKALLLAVPIVVLTQHLEQLWTAKAQLCNVCFACGLSGICVFILQVVNVYQTHRERDFFIPVRGSVGLLVAISVGLRHAYPLQPLPLLDLLPKALQLKCQHLPFALVVAILGVHASLPLWLLPDWQFGLFSFFFSWLYIRYFMWFQFAGSYGDHSSEMSFSNLFPQLLRPFVDCLAAVTYAVAVCVLPGWFALRNETESGLGNNVNGTAAYNVTAPEQNFQTESKEGRMEYEARRTKALAFLDENIAALLKVSEAGKANESAQGNAEESVDKVL